MGGLSDLCHVPVIIPLTSNVPANPQLPAPDGDFRAGVSAQAGSQGSASPAAGAQDGLGGPGAIRRAAGESLAGLKAAFWAGARCLFWSSPTSC